MALNARTVITCCDVDYLNSTNLDDRERKGVRQIHPNDNIRVQNVNQGILTQAWLACP